MNFNEKPNAVSGEEKQETFEANKAREEAIKQEMTAAIEQGDFAKVGTLAAEGTALRTSNEQTLNADRNEAEAMDADFDAEKARSEAEARQKEAERIAEEARLAQEAADKAIEDQAKLEELAAKIRNRGSESTQVSQEQGEPTEASFEANIVAQFGEPHTEIFEKYGKIMREKAKELVEVKWEMQKKWDELVAAGGSNKRPDLWNEHQALNNKRNKLVSDSTYGGEVMGLSIDNPDGSRLRNGVSSEEFGNSTREYHRTAMDDPVTILLLAEAGELEVDYREGTGVGQINQELRGNPEFMMKVLNALPTRDSAESFSVHTHGTTPEHRNLFIQAVKKNHLNYQWGTKDWKTDPEIQKIALESGLYPEYLAK